MDNLYPYGQAQTPLSQTYQPRYQQPQAQTYYPQQATGSLMTVYVNGEEDVNSYPIAPGTSVMLISFEKQKFWIKSRGNDGVPQPLRVFPFKEEQPVTNNQNGAVTREEFDSLSSKLDKLLEELGGTK